MVSTDDIRQLRDQTGAGMLDCREALRCCDGDLGKALEFLREKGAQVIERRADREAAHGHVATYSHHGAIGVLVEVRCETDFVSGSRVFRDLAHEIALQVAASSPRWVSREDVPTAVVDEIAAAERAKAVAAGKPDRIVEQIVAGKIERFFRETCLLEQPSIRDDKVTVSGLIHEKAAALDERLYVKRFARFAIADDDGSESAEP